MMKVKRMPTTPGEILKEEFLIPLQLTQKDLADHIGCDEKVIGRIINDQEPISTMLALKLASTFNTTPEFWLNLQRAVDFYKAYQSLTNQFQSELPAPIVNFHKNKPVVEPK